MSYEDAVKELGPCGIDCSRCVAYQNGDIVKSSNVLKEKLTNFEQMAKKMEKFAPVFQNYEAFLGVLEHFSKGNCPGCRNGKTPNAACTAKTCHKEEEVDFCFQCNSFPCTKNNFNDNLYDKWKKNNELMKEHGVGAFYNKQKEKPRY